MRLLRFCASSSHCCKVIDQKVMGTEALKDGCRQVEVVFTPSFGTARELWLSLEHDQDESEASKGCFGPR